MLMAREDKGSGTSSTQDAPSGKSGEPDTTSLAARRARLRGTLAKQIVPPDPYTPPPYESSQDEVVTNAAGVQVNAAGIQVNAAGIQVNAAGIQVNSAGIQINSADAQASANAVQSSLADEISSVSASAVATAEPPEAVNSQPVVNASVVPPTADPEVDSKIKPEARNRVSRSSDKASGSNGSNGASKSFFDTPDGAALVEAVGDAASSMLDSASSESGISDRSKKNNKDSKSLKPVANPFAGLVENRQEILEEEVSADVSPAVEAQTAAAPAPDAPVSAHSPAAMRVETTAVNSSQNSFDSAVQAQMLEMLSNIDQQLGICSLNMAHLSKAATEQLEVVRSLADIIQQQAFNEISLSLNSLSESMSAALEPMQAVGELVPAIDALVVTLGAKSAEPVAEKESETKLTPEQLVISLADQLSTGKIDPWTFKFAYMAVFPSEHPADLLRKLVDLLGSQHISGDFFRAAYDAVQAPDPPPRPLYTQPSGEGREVEIRVVQDETVLAQIEELRQQNELMRSRMDQREEDFAELLAAKDQEVQETQQMLNSRWEEFSSQYEKLSELVNQRNEMIQEKDRELSIKESELGQKETEISLLKSQLDEMRDQTRDMVADLQRQLTSTKAVAEEAARNQPKPSTSFFDQPQQPQSNASLFPEAAKPLFAPEAQAPAAPVAPPQPAPVPVAPPQPVAPNPIATTGSNPVVSDYAAASATSDNLPITPQAPTNQAIPRPQVAAPTTPFGSTAGSYGSGVRAQVFEVIVRQALAGAPWREICAGPMQVNNISADEVEAEVKRRQALLKK